MSEIAIYGDWGDDQFMIEYHPNGATCTIFFLAGYNSSRGIAHIYENHSYENIKLIYDIVGEKDPLMRKLNLRRFCKENLKELDIEHFRY